MRSRGSALPAIALATLALLPFANKAFTIDDTLFLRQAEHLLTDPLHPTAFEMTWTEVPARLSSIMPSGPVMAWLLVPALRLGGVEWAAHLATLLLLVVGLWATAGIARRIGLDQWGATVACLLVASAPAVLGMGATAMPDVPAMALGALGIERLLAWRDERRWHQGLISALGLGLAPLARSHLGLLLFVGVLALLDQRDPLLWASYKALPRSRWLPLVGALALSFAVMRITRDPLPKGASVAGAAVGFATLGSLHRNLVAFAAHWMLAMPLALPWAVVRGRAMPWRYAWFLLPAMMVLMALSGFAWHLGLAPLPTVGALALIDIVQDGWRRRDRVQLLLAAWLLVALPVCLYIQMAPKYVIASAPAGALLVARLFAVQKRRNLLALATVAIGLLLGVAILRADEQFSGLARRAVSTFIAPRIAAKQHVWFAGHWGFQWYAERAGARCLTKTPPFPAPGDVVVSSARSEGFVIDRFPNRRWIDGLADDTPGGRVMSRADCIGFYSDHWGILPWGWGWEPIDRFDVWEMGERN